MRLILQIVTVLSVVLFLYSCARVSHVFQRKERIYQPPRLGAEYRFEDGLKRERRPDDLFSKKDRREMEKMGMLSKQDRAAPKERITPMQADSILTGKTRDTTQTANPDSTQTVPVDTTQTTRRDSTQTVPIDTTQTMRQDSTQSISIDTTHPAYEAPVPAGITQRQGTLLPARDHTFTSRQSPCPPNQRHTTSLTSFLVI